MWPWRKKRTDPSVFVTRLLVERTHDQAIWNAAIDAAVGVTFNCAVEPRQAKATTHEQIRERIEALRR